MICLPPLLVVVVHLTVASSLRQSNLPLLIVVSKLGAGN